MSQPISAAKHGVEVVRDGFAHLNRDAERAEDLVDQHADEPEQPVNFRDIGELTDIIEQGRVFRSSQLLSPEDVRRIHIESVLDLRVIQRQCKKIAENELKVEHTDLHHQKTIDKRRHASPRSLPSPVIKGPRCKQCSLCSKAFGQKFHVSAPVYHANLMPLGTGLRIFWAMPTKVQLKAILGICKGRNPQKVMAPAVVDPATFGLTPLYKTMLDQSKPGVARALRLFANPDSYPILVHCIHGKDRTGLIIMLLLLLADVPQREVIADYIRSENALKHSRDQGNLHLEDHLTHDPALSSDAKTVTDIIAHLEAVYQGTRGYCKEIGLEDQEIAQIRQNLMRQPHPRDAVEQMTQHKGSLSPTTSKVAREVADTFTVHKTPQYLRCLSNRSDSRRSRSFKTDSNQSANGSVEGEPEEVYRSLQMMSEAS